MRSSLNKLYCTPILKTYYELLNTSEKIITEKLLKKNNLNKKNKKESIKFNSYKYMYQGLVKK